MIYTDVQLKEKITCLIKEFESEVVEFKEAKTNYSFNEIGKYFSALSNEAFVDFRKHGWCLAFLTIKNLPEQNLESRVD